MAFSDYYSALQHIGIPTHDLAAAEAFWTKLGFTKIGDFPVGQVIFMQRDNLVIETWYQEAGANQPGAINHISLDTTDAEGFDLIDSEVQQLAFWDKGIKFFNIQGPDAVIVEFCEIVK